MHVCGVYCGCLTLKLSCSGNMFQRNLPLGSSLVNGWEVISRMYSTIRRYPYMNTCRTPDVQIWRMELNKGCMSHDGSQLLRGR